MCALPQRRPRFKARVTVQSVTGSPCPRGNKVGDSWTIEDGITPGGMCSVAYIAIVLETAQMRFTGEGDVTVVSCPDPKHLVLYEVRRIRESESNT